MQQFTTFVTDQWILFLALAGILALLARTWIAPRLSGVKEVNPQEAVRLINSDNAVVLDVRLDNEYKEGHIVSALHIPLGTLEGRIKELEKHRGAPIVVNCRSGQRSMRGCQLLRKHGFDNVYNLSGGIMAWEKATLPLTKGGK